jgi:putative membrane protein
MNRTLALILFIAGIFFAVGYTLAYLPTEQFSSGGSIVSVVLLALPAFYGFYKLYGTRSLYSIIAVGFFALTIETIGISTGFPYGEFQYTLPIGSKIFGLTPWTVFIAWTPLVIGSFVLAHRSFKQWWSRFLVYLGLLVSVDTVLDPGAVARGLWTYTNGGDFYNVPLENFAGWLLSGTIAYLIITFILKNKKAAFSMKTASITSASLIISLTMWAGVNVAYQQTTPVVIAAILILLCTAILRSKTTKEILRQE